jgi:TonB family protein
MTDVSLSIFRSKFKKRRIQMIDDRWHSATIGNAVKLWAPAPAAAGSVSFQKLPSTVIDAVVGSPFSSQLSGLILALSAFCAAFVVAKLLAGSARLALISSRSTPVLECEWTNLLLTLCQSFGIKRSVQILQCRDASSMPSTWGLLRPRILLPAGAAEWSVERRRTVLAHELAHIARHDWLLQICAELVRAIYWFHPLVWFGAARLRNESECACDDSVLNGGIDAACYANQLLELARTLKNAHRGWSAALAIARPTNLERRFIAMLNPNLKRNGISRRTGLLLKVAALCLLLPLAALRLPGQNLSGKFTGTIFDPSGGAVPNATIVMTNHKANSCAPSLALPPCTVDMTTSNADGNFVFKALPAGEYEMKVLKPGFATYLAPQVVLEPGRDLAMMAKLNIGGINEAVDVQTEGSPKASEAETKAKAMRIRIGGNVEAAKVITRVQPIYPESAKAAGAQGTVLLHAVVGMAGRPLQLQVLNSQVNPDLGRAAVEAVSQWRYQPTLLNGEPVEIDTVITVDFKLLP